MIKNAVRKDRYDIFNLGHPKPTYVLISTGSSQLHF